MTKDGMGEGGEGEGKFRTKSAWDKNFGLEGTYVLPNFFSWM
jgi:hypothetical protein